MNGIKYDGRFSLRQRGENQLIGFYQKEDSDFYLASAIMTGDSGGAPFAGNYEVTFQGSSDYTATLELSKSNTDLYVLRWQVVHEGEMLGYVGVGKIENGVLDGAFWVQNNNRR